MPRSDTKRTHRRVATRLTPALSAALLIMSITMLAGIGLWFITGRYREVMHDAAIRQVRDQGELIARQLADQPAVRQAGSGDPGWQSLAGLVRSLRQVEPDLEYVSVTEQGEILYHDHQNVVTPVPVVPVRTGRTLVRAPEGELPLLTFTIPIPLQGGQSRSLQIAIRKAAIERHESTTELLITSMFRAVVVIVVLALIFSALLVVWIIRRDMARQRMRQEEEHLAFAGALADGIIHDLRNPMSSLHLDVQMLEKEAGREGGARPERLKELAARSRRTMERVDAVMREFLYVSKPDGRDRERIDLNTCIRECIDLVAARFEKEGIDLRTQFGPSDLPVTVYPISLKRAIVNILTNARDVSPPNSIVRVRTASDGTNAVIEIDDQGPGIPPADRQRIFEPFVTTRPGGTGLGLSLARAGINKSNGRIEIGENEWHGTCMRILVPLVLV